MMKMMDPSQVLTAEGKGVQQNALVMKWLSVLIPPKSEMRHRSRALPLPIPTPALSFPAVADAWRALKNPSIGESSIEGLTSVLSTSGSPTDGLSVMQGNYSETASFAALSGGTLSGGVLSGSKGKYSR